MIKSDVLFIIFLKCAKKKMVKQSLFPWVNFPPQVCKFYFEYQPGGGGQPFNDTNRGPTLLHIGDIGLNQVMTFYRQLFTPVLKGPPPATEWKKKTATRLDPWEIL